MPAIRCALHPARLAVDSCPRCRRPRCGADVATYGERGCRACVVTAPTTPVAPYRERVVRAGLAAFGVALVGGSIATQYVDVQFFSVAAPALVGLATGWASAAAAGGPRDARLRRTTLLVAAFAAVLSAALAFRLESGGGQDPLSSWDEVGPPYLAAVFGTLAWPIVFAPPPRKKSRDDE
ncbi:MAG: hypothetical protein JO079_00345 [Frankiaceae bacterium]|nr:hypothetical protein [Frankiaceae bacterium]MBV9369716.1 hypothetical protein [Frankiales bacterium]